MTPFDRRVRAEVYNMFLSGRREMAAHDVASSLGSEAQLVLESLVRLTAEHRLLVEADGRVVMAHPFSGVETAYRAAIGPHWWYANCAWDALALHGLVGEGRTEGPDGLVWEVKDGVVTPDGIVHLLVPARRFWDDVGFT